MIYFMLEAPKEEMKEIKPIYIGFIARMVSIRGPSSDEGIVVVSDFELHDSIGQSRGIINIPYNVDVMGNLGSAFKVTIKFERIGMEEYVTERTGAQVVETGTKMIGVV